MKYQDKVFGEVEISEPVILDLINSPSLQRLKGVDNAGYSDAGWFNGTSFSRFEHSVGVYILLNKYNAELGEQVAGLIHDVSHTVFSHCIDYALNPGAEKDQLFQDSVFDSFVRRSEIPEILEKHGLKKEYILDEKNFLLNERPLPDLCADRIDYSLRTAVAFRDVTRQDIEYFLKNLLAENSLWVFSNLESAKKFAELFFKMNRDYFSGFPSAVMLKTTGECLKYALAKNYITKEDLYAVDKQVLEKIQNRAGEDKNLKILLDRMNNRVAYKNNKEDYDFRVFCKSRVVNPYFKENGEIKRISDVDKNWQKIVEQESVPKEYFIKFDV